jgi:homotetrameric cytidine deaminase
MRILGLDFTSAPNPNKPLVCAECRLDHGVLTVQTLTPFDHFADFDALLQEPGPWVAGLDFPFSQPAAFIYNIEWPTLWADYVEILQTMDKADFVQILKEYGLSHPPGEKQLFRFVDGLAGGQSPMKADFVPVARMFFEGAPRILQSGACIPPLRMNESNRVIVEAYPALIARRLTRFSYKTDDRKNQTPFQAQAREEMIDRLMNQALRDEFGFRVDVGAFAQVLINDASGDTLDSFLCAMQAAWAALQADNGYGIPATPAAQEGWIPDPCLLLATSPKEVSLHLQSVLDYAEAVPKQMATLAAEAETRELNAVSAIHVMPASAAALETEEPIAQPLEPIAIDMKTQSTSTEPVRNHQSETHTQRAEPHLDSDLAMSPDLALQLLHAARDACSQAYTPYSHFPVGAALLTSHSEIITGVNVENVSYGLTICAERCAVFKAVSQGKIEFQAIAVWAAARPHGSVTPCGACRQVLAEFMPRHALVIMSTPEGDPRWLSLEALLPEAFDFVDEPEL